MVWQNFLNAVNATRDAGGNIVCAPGYTNAAVSTLSSTCAPLNLFGNGSGFMLDGSPFVDTTDYNGVGAIPQLWGWGTLP